MGEGQLEGGGIETPGVPNEIITDLPFVTVTHRPGFPTSGMATQTDSGWVIVLRAEEAKVRQRFSMIHEFKHVLDDPFIDWMYPTKHGHSPEDRAERICGYFAACVLMPIMWVKRDWAGGGIQDIIARRQKARQANPLGLPYLRDRPVLDSRHHDAAGSPGTT